MTRPTRLASQPLHRTLGAPLALASASLLGLILGLTGDGWRDSVAAFLLLLPLAAFARNWWRRSAPTTRTTAKKKVHS